MGLVTEDVAKPTLYISILSYQKDMQKQNILLIKQLSPYCNTRCFKVIQKFKYETANKHKNIKQSSISQKETLN